MEKGRSPLPSSPGGGWAGSTGALACLPAGLVSALSIPAFSSPCFFPAFPAQCCQILGLPPVGVPSGVCLLTPCLDPLPSLLAPWLLAHWPSLPQPVLSPLTCPGLHHLLTSCLRLRNPLKFRLLHTASPEGPEHSYLPESPPSDWAPLRLCHTLSNVTEPGLVPWEGLPGGRVQDTLPPSR